MTEAGKNYFPWKESLAILALFNLAVAYPLYEVLGRNAEFLVFKRTTPFDIILLTIALSILFPLLMVLLIKIIASLHPRLSPVLSGIVIGTLISLILLPLWNRHHLLPPTISVVALTLISIGIAAGYFKFPWIRTFILFLAPAIVVVPSVFLTRPMIYKILSSSEPAIPFYRVHSNTPIVMVVFDEFPITSLLNENREVDSRRFPNFVRFMKHATWYRNATSVAERTTDSVPAILTGNYPAKSRLPIARDYPNNLFTLLGRSYQMQIHETVTRLCPEILDPQEHPPISQKFGTLFSDLSLVYLHIILPLEWAETLPPVSQAWGNFGLATGKIQNQQQNGTAPFMALLNSISDDTRPTLYFVHTDRLPHTPWHYLPSGKDYGISNAPGMIIREEKWIDDQFLVTQGYQRHLLQVAYVDHLIGRLLDRLQEKGLYDRSLIVIAADHGISFNKSGSYRLIGKSNYKDIIRIPLFIKAPFQKAGTVNDWNVETIDILPTIAKILEIQLPWQTAGVPVLNQPPKRDHKVAFSLYCRDRFEFDKDLTGIDPTLEMKISAFGTGSFDPRFYDTGICSQRIGESISSNLNESGLSWTLSTPEKFESVDTKSSFVPAYISGQILNTTNPNLMLAVAINGKLRGTTRSYRFHQNTAGFSLMVPEDVFQNGSNRIDLYLLTDCSSKLQFISKINGESSFIVENN